MSTGYLVERQLEDNIALPLSLPATLLEPDSEIILSVVQLSGSSQRLKHLWMQIKIIERDPATPANPTVSDPTNGFVYGGIFDSDGVVVAGSTTQCTDTTLDPPLLGSGPAADVDLLGPVSPAVEEYTYKIVNNCHSTSVQVVATGAWRVVLNEAS
jgi:hypothetical protein